MPPSNNLDELKIVGRTTKLRLQGRMVAFFGHSWKLTFIYEFVNVSFGLVASKPVQTFNSEHGIVVCTILLVCFFMNVY